MTGILVLLLYYTSHGVPRQFDIGGISIPFEGILRTVVAVIFYSVVVVHAWEMSEGFKLCRQHRADAVTTVRFI